jgi:hypothetical protein
VELALIGAATEPDKQHVAGGCPQRGDDGDLRVPGNRALIHPEGGHAAAARPCRGMVDLWENGMESKRSRWKFGTGQTTAQERSEINAAHAAGRTEAYAAGQEYARLIEAETARRRARHGKGRAR